MALPDRKPDVDEEVEMDMSVAFAGRTLSLDRDAADRLARLSADVGCTPEQTLADGLFALEQLRKEEGARPHIWTAEDDADMRQAIAEFEMGGGIPHEQVMAEARAIVGA